MCDNLFPVDECFFFCRLEILDEQEDGWRAKLNLVFGVDKKVFFGEEIINVCHKTKMANVSKQVLRLYRDTKMKKKKKKLAKKIIYNKQEFQKCSKTVPKKFQKIFNKTSLQPLYKKESNWI